MGLCTAKVPGRNLCPYPKVESAEISLCARHILVAANEVNELGRDYLESVVRAEMHATLERSK